MTVYYITFACVFFLCAIAQAYDSPYPSKRDTLQIRHAPLPAILLFAVIMILVCVSGFRFRVGTDYGAYYYNYKIYANGLVEAFRELSEPGYPLSSWLATKIYDNGATAIFIAALVTIYPALRVVYHHTDRVLLATFLFLMLGCWHGSFNGVRQYLAATMLFCGYEYLESKQFWKYLFFVFLAFLFHRSAIVMAALYFAVHQKINLRNLAIVVAGTLVLFTFYDRVLEFAGWITESDYSMDNAYASHAVNTLRVLAASAPAAVFLVLYWRQDRTPRETFFLNLTVIHAAIRIATMSSALLYRIGIYTTLFQVIAIPELLKGLPPKTKKSITFVMIPLFAYFWWYEVSKSYYLNNFQWIWSR